MREDPMSNIVRSFLDELVPRWKARRTVGQAQHTADPQQIEMPVDVPMPPRKEQRPHRPKPEPSHWRAPNM
jgi:hypothetical protein